MANMIDYKEMQHGDWQVLSVIGRIDTLTAAAVEVKINEVSENAAKLALDLTEVEYLSSAGLRILLRTAKKLKSERKELRLVGVHRFVKEVLDMSGMAVFFKFVDEVAAL